MAIQNELSLITLQKKFSTEASCLEKLFKIRWPLGFKCPKCGHNHYYFIKTRNIYQCKKCKYQASITAGTIFHKSKIPLVKWFWAIYLISRDKGGVSALSIQKNLNISYPTAWLMLHKIRHAMNNRDLEYNLITLLEIENINLIGKPKLDKKYKFPKPKKLLVQVAISSKDNSLKYTKISIVKDFKPETIDKILDNYKNKHFKEYKNIYDYDEKMQKRIKSWISTILHNLKSFLYGTYHCGCRKHLQKFIDEFCYRFNRRNWERQLFNRLINACLNCDPFPYYELTL